MRKAIIILIILSLGLSILGYGLYKHYSTKTPSEKLNTEIAKSLNMINFTPLYFKPAVDKIGGADGFQYKDKSLVISEDLLSFEFINKTGATIAVAQQKKPENFAIEEYSGRIQLNVATGKAIVGQNKNSSSASIFGDKTFLFLRSEEVIDDDTLRAILSAFSNTL